MDWPAGKKNAFAMNKKKNDLRIAGFMSGEGSNLRRIIESEANVVVIFTDVKDEKKCNARKISSEYGIPLIERDIKEYYLSRGFADRKDMKTREEFDSETARQLERFNVNFIALCGYRSILTSAIYNKFTTINVHPADLTRLDANGKRIYAGCAGVECIERAKANGDSEVKSTFHLVNGDVDGGPILALSDPVKIRGDLSDVQDELKRKGDWVIYPKVIRMFEDGNRF